MGLDYAVARYPKEHICAAANELPASGPDSVVYPNIEFQITKFEETSKCFNYHPQKAENVLYQEYLNKGLIKEI
jgi:hypothetical protein